VTVVLKMKYVTSLMYVNVTATTLEIHQLRVVLVSYYMEWQKGNILADL